MFQICTLKCIFIKKWIPRHSPLQKHITSLQKHTNQLQKHTNQLQKHIYATVNMCRRNPAGLSSDSMLKHIGYNLSLICYYLQSVKIQALI